MQPFKPSVSLVWLRRDLRLHDHAALAEASRSVEPLQPAFIFDRAILKDFPNKQDRRLSFIASQLAALHAQLKTGGGGLLVLEGVAGEVIPRLAKALSAARVVAEEDYEPATRARDEAVASAAPLQLVKDHVVFSPTDILRDTGEAFKVFTPYFKQWRKALEEHPANAGEYHVPQLQLAPYMPVVEAVREAGLAVLDAGSPKAMLADIGYQWVQDGLWDVTDASSRLKRFAEKRMGAYATGRDMVAVEGTSRLSPYLRFGLVSPRECVRAALKAGSRGEKWLSELAWREFYAAILYHFPESQTKEWNPKFRGLAWEQREDWLEAWKQGRTGFPLVDAAQRQLLAEGWMHNRARMVTASFLTKDLQLDWRLGEAHFAQYLMDYDMASNVGGWQWAASTGTDAQPWFRIFNPTLQSKKFDPAGEYISRYVAELRGLSAERIHEPGKGPRPADYPAPIVDHKQAREKTLAMFNAVSDGD